MTNESPSSPSPSDSQLEKGAMAGDLASDQDRREEIEEMNEDDREARSEKDRTSLRIPLQQVRSHSSARSARSHTDGYSHFEEEDQAPNDRGNENSPATGKEFEVKFGLRDKSIKN